MDHLNDDVKAEGKLMKGTTVNNQNQRTVQGRLLFLSLLENYCEIYEGKRKELFIVLCTQLLKMGVLNETDLGLGNLPIRNAYKFAIQQLVNQSLQQLKDVPSLDVKSRYLNDFQQGVKLGKGAFGSVFTAKNLLDGMEYAIKKIKFDEKDRLAYGKMLREVYSLARLDHKYVVRYYSAWIEENQEIDQASDQESISSNDSFLNSQNSNTNLEINCEYEQQFNLNFNSINEIVQNDNPNENIRNKQISLEKDVNLIQNINEEDFNVVNEITIHNTEMVLYIQMQLCHYTLQDWIFLRNEYFFDPACHLSEDLDHRLKDLFNGGSIKIFHQIVQGLHYIHSQNFIHRDLKPQNIFFHVGEEVLLKIGDFSLVSMTSSSNQSNLDENENNSSLDMTIGVGTLTYASPEQLVQNSIYDQKADIYSLGIIFFELLHPFYSQSERIQEIQKLRNDRLLPDSFLRSHPTEAAFILWCTGQNPSERPSTSQILELDLFSPDERDSRIKELEEIVLNLKTQLAFYRNEVSESK